jgi:leader peptidase (prepilin peptidase) / N-methyltransferase
MDVIQLLDESPALLILIAGLFGLMVGSFLNVVILRLPVMMEREWRAHCAEHQAEVPAGIPGSGPVGSDLHERFNLVTPRSRCPSCGHAITALENIPIVSWLMLRGRCSSCGTRISARYPLIELSTAVLSMIVAWQLGATAAMLAVLALTWALIALSVIDIDHQLLPDSITLPFLWLGLVLNLSGLFTDIGSAVIGAVAGYLSLWSIYWLFRLTTGKEGMGYGDFKLLALFGAWLGWQYLLPVVLISSLVGAAIGITLIVTRGRDRNIPIPFGPYLAVAGWITLLWGRDIIAGYWWWMGAQ